MKTVRLYGNPNYISTIKAIELLSNKCKIVVVPLETKTSKVASEDGFLRALKK